MLRYKKKVNCCSQVSKKNNGKVIVTNAEGEVGNIIPFKDPNSAYDVLCLDDSTIAVSTGYSCYKPGISIVDLNDKKWTNSLTYQVILME